MRAIDALAERGRHRPAARLALGRVDGRRGRDDGRASTTPTASRASRASSATRSTTSRRTCAALLPDEARRPPRQRARRRRQRAHLPVWLDPRRERRHLAHPPERDARRRACTTRGFSVRFDRVPRDGAPGSARRALPRRRSSTRAATARVPARVTRVDVPERAPLGHGGVRRAPRRGGRRRATRSSTSSARADGVHVTRAEGRAGDRARSRGAGRRARRTRRPSCSTAGHARRARAGRTRTP